MTLPDLSYLLYWRDEAIAVTHDMTIGTQADNDLTIQSADMREEHVRIELSERGPVWIPLGGAVINVNGVPTRSPVQVIIGDVIGLGETTFQVGVEIESRASSTVDRWVLQAEDGTAAYPIHGEMIVGRAEAADVYIPHERISRHHARLVEHDQNVWIQDYRSANGTRINGMLIQGGARLFAGDSIAFDHEQYRLVNQHESESVNAALASIQRLPWPRVPIADNKTQVLSAVGAPSAQPSSIKQARRVRTSSPAAYGPRLPALVDSQSNEVIPLGLGETVIGRDAHCDLQVSDETVSREHARIKVSPDGVSVLDLMSTNGIYISGEKVVAAELEEGDCLTLGRIVFRFHGQSRAPKVGFLRGLRGIVAKISE